MPPLAGHFWPALAFFNLSWFFVVFLEGAVVLVASASLVDRLCWLFPPLVDLLLRIVI